MEVHTDAIFNEGASIRALGCGVWFRGGYDLCGVRAFALLVAVPHGRAAF